MARKFGMTVKKNAKPYKSKTKATMTTKWINNAMKSIGMSASTQFKNLTPVMSDTFSTLKSSAMDIRTTAKNSNMESVRASIENNKYVKYGKKAINNALEDIKAGTFNNDSRFMSGDDDDTSNDYGGWSFGDIDDEEGGGVTINYDGPDESEAVNATYEVNRSINKQTEATLTSSKATIDTLISTSAASLLQSQQLGNEIINHLNSVNSTLSSIQAFQQENTMKMYEMLTTFIEKTGPKEETKEYKDNPTDPMNVFTGGRFSASGYKNYLKASIGKAIKNNPHLAMLGILNDDETLSMLASNPLVGISDAIAGKIIPHTLTTVASSLDKAAAEFIPTMLARISKLATSNEVGLKGELKRFIGQAFGVKSSINNETSSEGKITKDAATFDKITRNSIVEIIPKYLREGNAYLKTIAEKVNKNGIEGNLRDSQVFDTKSGGYIKLSDVNKSITDGLTETIADVFNKSQFGVTLSSAIGNLKQEDQEGMDKLMEQLAVLIAEKSGEINGGDLSKGSEMDKILKQLEYSNKNQELLIRNVISEMSQSRDFGTSLNSYRVLAHGAFNEALDDYNGGDLPNWFSSDYNNNSDVFGTIYKNKGYTKAIKNRKEIEEAEKRLARRKTKESEKGMKSLNRMSKKDIKNVARDTVKFMSSDNGNVRATLSETDEDNDILTRTGGHIKNAMWELMFGSSTAAKNEFAEIFTEPMKGLYKTLKKDVFDPFKKSLFGKKDENGTSEGGIFSGLKNGIKDAMSELSHAITGKEYTDTKGEKHEESKNSVHSNITSMFNTIRKGVGEKLFGKSDKDIDISEGAEKVATKGKGVITGFVDVLGKGLAGWREALFGNEEDMSPEEFKEDTIKRFKEGLPDALTGSLIGAGTSALAGGSLLGTLIGGPIGGAVIGFAGGFLKRSEKFQNFLFGEKDEETGERLGGFISRETQEFVKKNKNLIAGGATVGLASSVILGKSGGFLGSLVGGPIAGAIMGVGTTFLLRSKTFNDFLFGNEEEGKKGVLQAFKGFLKKQSDEGGPSNAKKLGMGALGVSAGALTMAAVSKVGLLSFMAGPTGIIGGALVGLGLSIKAQSHNFREWLFGSKEKTESGEKKKAGLVGKISNALTAYLLNPIKNKAKYIWQDIKDTVKYDILDVLRLSISPITNGIANFFKKTKDGTSKLFHIFADNFSEKVKPVLNAIIAPIGGAISKVTDAIYSVANNIVTFPFKVIAKIGATMESIGAKIVKGTFQYIIHPVAKLALSLTKGAFHTLKLGMKILLTPFRAAKRGVGALAGKVDDKLGGFFSKRREAKKEKREKELQDLEANGEDNFKTNRRKRKIAKGINKENKKNNKRLNKNQKLIYKWTNGERVLFTEENARIAEANAARAGKKIKWKDFTNEDGNSGFELTPEERKEREKAKILAGKSNNDIAGANDAELNIEERQLSVLQRIYNFLLGKTPDGKDPKEKDKEENENTNPEENPEEGKQGILKRLAQSKGLLGKFSGWASNKIDALTGDIKSAENAVDNYRVGDISKFAKRKFMAHKAKRADEKNRELVYRWTNGEETEYNEETKRLAEANASRQGVTIHWLGESDESRDETVNQIDNENPGIAHYAKGTKRAKKGLAVVGEKKPEIVDFGGGERVHSDNYAPIGVRIRGFSKFAIKNITDAISIAEPKTSASSHLDPFAEKIKNMREERKKKEEEKEKKDAEELKEAQEKGSYQNKHKDEEENVQATKNPIVNVINKLRNENKSHHRFLSGILGLFSKKGIIGAGLIALSPFILKYLPTILKTAVDHLPDIINIGKKLLSFLGTAVTKTVDYFTNEGTTSNHTNGKTGFQETTDEIEDSVKDLKNGDIGGLLLNDETHETDSTTGTKINTLLMPVKKLMKTKAAINLVKKDSEAFEKNSIKHLWNRARYSKFDRGVAQLANTDEVKVVSKGAKSLKAKAGQGIKNLATSAKNKGVEVAKSGASKLANSKAGNAVKAVGRKGIDVAKNAAAKSAEKGGLLSKVINILQKVFDTLSSKFTSLASKKGATKGIESGSKNIFKNAFNLAKEAFTKKFPQISGKLSALFAADGALAATTAGIGNLIKNAGFSIVFGINEASNPRRLFRIPKGSKVDWKMRLVAAMWGAIKGHGVFGSILDIANSIWHDNEGAGLIDMVSEQLYKLLCTATGDDKAAENLDKLQKQQLEKYEQYKEDKIREAYEKYLEENNLDEEDLSYEDYIQGVNDGKYPKPEYMSVADYNASENKTIGGKIIDAGAKVLKPVWNVAKKGVKALWGGVKTVAKVGWKGAKLAGKAIKTSVKYSPLGLGVRAISDVMTLNSKKEVKCWVDKDKNRIYVKDGKGFQVFNLKNNKYLDTITDKDEVAEINEAIENGDYEVSKFPVKYMKTMLRSVEAIAGKATKAVKGAWNSLFGKKKKKKKSNKTKDKEKAEAKLQELKYGWFSKEDLSYYVENEDKTWSHYGADGNLITKIVDDEELSEFKLDRSLGKYTKQPIQGGIKDANAAANKIKNIIGNNGESTKEVADRVVAKTRTVWDFFFGKNKKKSKDKDKNKKDSGSGGETLFDMIKGQISGAGNNTDDNESVNGFKYFSQYNKKWRDKNYSSGKNKGTIGSAGCGPASMSMVVSQLSGQSVTPDVMADYARQNGYRDEGGTNSKFMETAGSKYGINNTRLDHPTSSEVISQIKKGNPVILNGVGDGSPNSPYTSKGHYIVAVGVDSKGNVIVNDPRGKGFSGRVNPKVLDSQSRVGWVYSKKKRGGYGYGDKNGKIQDKGIIGKLKSRANRLFNFSGAGEDSDKDKVVQARQAVWAWMRAIENKLTYSQTYREDSDADKGLTGTGSGDCSSTVRWAYHKALGSDFPMGSNTRDQCSKQYPWNDVVTFPSDEIDKNGTKNLLCGDLIYFHETNVNHPCHVEMYIGAGEGKQVMGHGGGTDGSVPGPHYGTIAGYAKGTPVYCIKRLITEESVHGRTITFPDGVSVESSDAVVDNSSSKTSNSTDSSSDNILTKWQSAFSDSFDKISTGATNYIMSGDKSKLTVDNTSTNSSEDGTSTNGTTTYPEVAVATGDVPKAVWDFFTKLGYSKAATAGIMGNLQQESGFNPSNIQGGGAGPAAGIAQWENYNKKNGRWLALSNYAKSKGKDWTDLQSQLEYMDYELNNTLEPYFTKDIAYGGNVKGSTHANAGSVPISVADWKKSTDVDMATRQFEAGFERAGKPHMENRIPAAQTYYNQFAGTSGSGGDDESMAMIDDYYQKFEDDISKEVSGSGSNNNTFRYNGNIYDKQNYNRTDSLNKINQRNIINNNMNTANMESLLTEVINVLNDIKSNTHDSYEALNKLPSSGNSNNLIVAGNRSSGTTNTSSSINRIKNKNYQLATKIALG